MIENKKLGDKVFFRMSSKNETTWYVEPVGATTNRAIADFLGQDSTESEERIFVLGVGNVNAYRVPHRVITQMRNTRGLRFHVYHQKGKGEISKWYFPPKKKKVPKKKTAQAKS